MSSGLNLHEWCMIQVWILQLFFTYQRDCNFTVHHHTWSPWTYCTFPISPNTIKSPNCKCLIRGHVPYNGTACKAVKKWDISSEADKWWLKPRKKEERHKKLWKRNYLVKKNAGPSLTPFDALNLNLLNISHFDKRGSPCSIWKFSWIIKILSMRNTIRHSSVWRRRHFGVFQSYFRKSTVISNCIIRLLL